MDKRLLNKLSFAKEKLSELKLIAETFDGTAPHPGCTIKIVPTPEDTDFGVNKEVQNKIQGLKEEDFIKPIPYSERAKLQKKVLKLPPFPTTTIGSYPQTLEVRTKRKDFINGKISEQEYKKFIKGEIKKLIELQEEVGLDVLVHGEFERTDMVEFFAKKLEGIATTKEGWIISYGTRVYRPPIIYGDVSRKNPMTVEEIAFAQSLTNKPVKGMLTGPVTITGWSYVREDIPVSDVAYQIALCLQDEIRDYEASGIKIVQIDEPAFRESPYKKEKLG